MLYSFMDWAGTLMALGGGAQRAAHFGQSGSRATFQVWLPGHSPMMHLQRIGSARRCRSKTEPRMYWSAVLVAPNLAGCHSFSRSTAFAAWWLNKCFGPLTDGAHIAQ